MSTVFAISILYLHIKTGLAADAKWITSLRFSDVGSRDNLTCRVTNASTVAANNPWKKKNALDQFRMEKIEYFRSDPQSPLTRDRAERFEGLAYYPENPALALELPVEKAKSTEVVNVDNLYLGCARVRAIRILLYANQPPPPVWAVSW